MATAAEVALRHLNEAQEPQRPPGHSMPLSGCPSNRSPSSRYSPSTSKLVCRRVV